VSKKLEHVTDHLRKFAELCPQFSPPPPPRVTTEHRGRKVNTPTSSSGGSGFDSWHRRPAILNEVFRDLSQSLETNAGILP
jgi:hypothetical protein